MEIRVLKYFLTVAREGSITRAAEILHVTQPTLSRQILELERETGVFMPTSNRDSSPQTPHGQSPSAWR